MSDESMYPSWNVAIRDAKGGVRAEFAIYANTPAQALRATAPNVVDYPYAHTIEITRYVRKEA